LLRRNRKIYIASLGSPLQNARARAPRSDHRVYDLSGFTSYASNISRFCVDRSLHRWSTVSFRTHGLLLGTHRAFDEKIVFRPLYGHQREIAGLAMKNLPGSANAVSITVSDEAFEFLVRRGIKRSERAQ
jgi:hypothetical protein